MSLSAEDGTSQGRRRQIMNLLTGTSQSSTSSTGAKPDQNVASINTNKGNTINTGTTEQSMIGNILEAQELEKKKQQWASWADGNFQRMKNAREPFDRQWYLNLAFYLGRQYIQPVSVPGQGFRLTSPRTPSHRVKLVVNKIRPAVRTECAKLTSSRPIPVVVPATNEEEDVSASRVAEALLTNQFVNADFEAEYRSAIFWSVVTGCGYIKDYWNKYAPDPLSLQEDKPPVGLGPEGSQPSLGKSKVNPAMGRISIERVTPFHVYVPDLMSERINDQPFLIHCMTQTPLWVKKNFPEASAAPDTKSTSTIMDASFMISKGREDVFDAVIVKEVWIKPGGHQDFPEGGMLTVINGKVVQAMMKWPLPFNEYPFHKIDGLPTGGYYSDSIIVDLIPLQKEYNRTKSQSIEIKNMMGKPKFLYAKGSVNIRQVNTEAGQGIPYIAGYDKPTILPGAEIPQSLGIELDRMTQEFDDLSGQHEISRGGTPNSAISSGTAIAFLQEQDDLKLNYQVSSIERGMEALGSQVLKFISTKWDTERIIRITGKDDAFESMVWKGSDLRGNHDVKVQTGSALPFSKAARQAMITEFMQNGWLPPEVGMDILQMGAFDKALNDMLIDKRQAQRENLKMAKMDEQVIAQKLTPPEGGATTEEGQPVDPQTGQLWAPQPPISVNSWDNHAVHVQFHNNYRKTQDFELLSDSHKQSFELHVQAHNLALQGAPMEGQLGQQPSGMPPEQQQAMMEQGQQPDPALAEQQAAQQAESQGAQDELAQQGTQAEQLRSQEVHELTLEDKKKKSALEQAILIKKLNESSQNNTK